MSYWSMVIYLDNLGDVVICLMIDGNNDTIASTGKAF